MVATRLCVGCGVRAPKQDLLRVVHLDGRAVIDKNYGLPGRGASVHQNPECIAKAVKRGSFARALRVSGMLDTFLIEKEIENTMDK